MAQSTWEPSYKHTRSFSPLISLFSSLYWKEDESTIREETLDLNYIYFFSFPKRDQKSSSIFVWFVWRRVRLKIMSNPSRYVYDLIREITFFSHIYLHVRESLFLLSLSLSPTVILGKKKFREYHTSPFIMYYFPTSSSSTTYTHKHHKSYTVQSERMRKFHNFVGICLWKSCRYEYIFFSSFTDHTILTTTTKQKNRVFSNLK